MARTVFIDVGNAGVARAPFGRLTLARGSRCGHPCGHTRPARTLALRNPALPCAGPAVPRALPGAAGGAPAVPFGALWEGDAARPHLSGAGGTEAAGPGWAGSQPAAAPWYASLYFCCAIEDQDNELLTLEVVHRYVELLDKYFGNVCELDIIFNFEKAYFILDEFIIGGEVQETSKKTAVKAIEDSDMLQETVEEYMNKPAF
ncbi:AP-1 complex subunit sigma-3 isoform X1 [Passer montanus]|uniref:AP-1 complex subunit sigma-3 isoform X1 n=1 Tax=Passer montanus TaxID=9160 RepID=UPI00195F6C6A|nr:AP-1 complex subunit sigma-3 isoform X1 [Passer montanus]